MNNLVYFGGYDGWSIIVIVSWTVENNLFFLSYFSWSIIVIMFIGFMIVIVSWSYPLLRTTFPD